MKAITFILPFTFLASCVARDVATVSDPDTTTTAQASAVDDDASTSDHDDPQPTTQPKACDAGR